MSLACYDCGRLYGDEYGFPDLVVPREVWNKHISPTQDEGGLLCPSCMCQRAAAAGLSDVPTAFRSGPFSANGAMRRERDVFATGMVFGALGMVVLLWIVYMGLPGR